MLRVSAWGAAWVPPGVKFLDKLKSGQERAGPLPDRPLTAPGPSTTYQVSTTCFLKLANMAGKLLAPALCCCTS